MGRVFEKLRGVESTVSGMCHVERSSTYKAEVSITRGFDPTFFIGVVRILLGDAVNIAEGEKPAEMVIVVDDE